MIRGSKALLGLNHSAYILLLQNSSVCLFLKGSDLRYWILVHLRLYPPNYKPSSLWPQELGLLPKDLWCKEQKRSAFFAEKEWKGKEGERQEKHVQILLPN